MWVGIWKRRKNYKSPYEDNGEYGNKVAGTAGTLNTLDATLSGLRIPVPEGPLGQFPQIKLLQSSLFEFLGINKFSSKTKQPRSRSYPVSSTSYIQRFLLKLRLPRGMILSMSPCAHLVLNGDNWSRVQIERIVFRIWTTSHTWSCLLVSVYRFCITSSWMFWIVDMYL